MTTSFRIAALALGTLLTAGCGGDAAPAPAGGGDLAAAADAPSAPAVEAPGPSAPQVATAPADGSPQIATPPADGSPQAAPVATASPAGPAAPPPTAAPAVAGPTPVAPGGAVGEQGSGPTLSTTLHGPAIGGVAPSADATVGQYPPNVLRLRVTSVNLPDGTALTVSLAGYDLGAVTLAGGQGEAVLPVGFQVGYNSLLAIRAGATTLLIDGWL
jgi:hypothetical protein